MNLCLFFEGTGHGVAGKITNVTRLRDLSVDDPRQKLHLEPGLGTHFGSYLAGKIAGLDWRTTFRSARRWFETNYETLPKDGVSTKVFLFGFSQKLDATAVVLHDSHDESSNLWGAFSRVRRHFPHVKLHFACKNL